VFVEVVEERDVVAGFGEVVPWLWIRGEEGLHGAEELGTADEAGEVIGLPDGIQGAEAGLVEETA